ncbi:MAG: FAA hydrolase family protein [Deltaproteobacteria bacterium]|nr:MAG: FAA hydrolase family protein [Deltaproteobacteria bacterium]
MQRRRLDQVDHFVALDAEGHPAGASLDLALLGGRHGYAPRELLQRLDAPDVTLLAPVLPGKIVCVGLNYRHHAEEMGKAIPDAPLLFLKPPSAVIGPGAPIVLPPDSSEVHHEGELAVIIGRSASRISPARVPEHILGYTLLNDVTARDIQRRENKYTRAKGYDTFAPLGPTIVPDLDPAQLVIETRVNGEVRQSSSCGDMIFPVAELISHISHIMTLLPGDVISTGTPSGVGPLRPGDVVEVSIPEIGVLSNPVEAFESGTSRPTSAG